MDLILFPSPGSRRNADAANLIAGGGESQTSEEIPDKNIPVQLTVYDSIDLPRNTGFTLRTFSLTLRRTS
jgi:hypothetical protein